MAIQDAVYAVNEIADLLTDTVYIPSDTVSEILFSDEKTVNTAKAELTTWTALYDGIVTVSFDCKASSNGGELQLTKTDSIGVVPFYSLSTNTSYVSYATDICVLKGDVISFSGNTISGTTYTIKNFAVGYKTERGVKGKAYGCQPSPSRVVFDVGDGGTAAANNIMPLVVNIKTTGTYRVFVKPTNGTPRVMHVSGHQGYSAAFGFQFAGRGLDSLYYTDISAKTGDSLRISCYASSGTGTGSRVMLCADPLEYDGLINPSSS